MKKFYTIMVFTILFVITTVMSGFVAYRLVMTNLEINRNHNDYIITVFGHSDLYE